MKKVFSIEKFVANCIADGDGVDYDDVIDRHSWALVMDGHTEEETEAMDYGTCDEWMVEVEDTEEVIDESV